MGFKGKYGDTRGHLDVRLSMLKFKEDDVLIIYSPALDLSGYGKDLRSAKRSFEIAMEEFARYTTNKGTLEKELKRLGWKITGTKRAPMYQQPFLDELFTKRTYLGEIFRDKEFHRFEQEVVLPAA